MIEVSTRFLVFVAVCGLALLVGGYAIGVMSTPETGVTVTDPEARIVIEAPPLVCAEALDVAEEAFAAQSPQLYDAKQTAFRNVAASCRAAMP